MAEQATNYVNYVFWQDNAGFLTLYGAFKDALTVKTGFVKWWTDNTKETKRKQFENITMEQLQMLLAEDPTAKRRARLAPAERHRRRRRHRRRGRQQADHPRRGRAAGRDAPRPLRQDLLQVAHRRPRTDRLHR